MVKEIAILLALGLSSGAVEIISSSQANSQTREPQVRPAPGRLSAAARAANIYCQQVDRYVASHPSKKQIFASTYTRSGKTSWHRYRSEKERAQLLFGEPDTYANVWLQKGSVVYAVHERGMTSSTRWFEKVRYWFRSDGSIAKIYADTGDGMGRRMGHLQLFNSKGEVLHSTVTFLDERGRRTQPQKYRQSRQPIYKRVQNLPYYHLLKKLRPQS